jgi:hypothetical protein
MKKIFLFCALLVSSSYAISQNNSTKFGVELELIPSKLNFREIAFSSYSGYLGFYTEMPVYGNFTAKFRTGLHNVRYRNLTSMGYMDLDGVFTKVSLPDRGYIGVLSVAFEPRFYLFKEEQKYGNFFASIPLSFETVVSGEKDFPVNSLNDKITILPSLGYRYLFSKHWNIEANAGIGWGKEIVETPSPKLEYTLSAKIGYSF